MTDIEALRARMRCDVTGNLVGTDTRMIGAPPCGCQGCRADAEITRLREELDRVTRERDEALKGIGPDKVRRDTFDLQNRALNLMERRAEAAEAALAKRDEEVAAVRSDAHFLLDLLMVHAPAQVTEHPDVVLLRRKIHGPEALTQEPTNAEC
jgi:hypothetical protein